MTLCISLLSLNYMHSQDFHIMDKNKPKYNYGIEGKQAPQLSPTIEWVNAEGQNTKAIQLDSNDGKYKVIYGFQSWCPGCHSRGLPSLQKMVNALGDNENINFYAIQTVFEGHHTNTKEKMIEVQKQYDLAIPFGHDTGDASTNNRSVTLEEYRTGGTPWFIIINEENKVIFNDFQLNTDKFIEYFSALENTK